MPRWTGRPPAGSPRGCARRCARSRACSPRKSLYRDPWNSPAFVFAFIEGLPALGLDVVHVRVLAHRDRRHHAPDVGAVLDHRRILGEAADRELVPDGDVGPGAHLDVLVLVHDPAGELLSSLDALHHDDADRVVLVVNHEMNHRLRSWNDARAAARVEPKMLGGRVRSSQLDELHDIVAHVPAAVPRLRALPASDRPLYVEVRARLIEAISAGAWRPGEAIPSEAQLARGFGVAIGTIRKAVDSLVAEQALVRRQGKGTYVAAHDGRRLMFHFFHVVARDGSVAYP